MKMPIQIGQHVFDEDVASPDVQIALLKQREDNLPRPMCICRPRGIPLYSARLSLKEKFVVKRMPSTGHLHALDCDHYEPPDGINGFSAAQGQAIDENPETGQINLRLGFSLSKLDGRAPPKPTDTKAATVKDTGGKLSLLGFLHTLWHTAHLDRWQPDSPRRTYTLMRREILRAADTMLARKNVLAQRMAVPEAETPDAEIKGEAQRQFSRRLKTIAAPSPKERLMGIVIGEFYGFADYQTRKTILIKCAFNERFYLSDELKKALDRRFEIEFALLANNPDEHLMTVFTYYYDAANYAHISEITFMHCNKEWIPYETRAQGEFLRELISNRRSFERSLRVNLDAKTLLATATLLDTEEATALYLIEHALTPEEQTQLDNLNERGVKVWIRDASHSEPAIPSSRTAKKKPTDGKQPTEAEHAITQLFDEHPSNSSPLATEPKIETIDAGKGAPAPETHHNPKEEL